MMNQDWELEVDVLALQALATPSALDGEVGAMGSLICASVLCSIVLACSAVCGSVVCGSVVC